MTPERPQSVPLTIGTATNYGPICGITCLGGERYYFMSQGRGDVALMPASVIEWMHRHALRTLDTSALREQNEGEA